MRQSGFTKVRWLRTLPFATMPTGRFVISKRFALRNLVSIKRHVRFCLFKRGLRAPLTDSI